MGPDVTANDHPSAADTVNRLDLSPRPGGRATAGQDDPKDPPAATAVYGDPVELTARVASEADPTGAYTLNFENTPIATVAQSVLGDILNLGYIVDPRAQGTISLSSGRPIPKKDLLFVLENALKANGLALVRDAAGYRILPASDNVVGTVDRAEGGRGVEPGYGLTVIPVQYISASALAKLMEGFATKPGAVRPDPSGRMLLVLGTGAERQAAVDTMRDFDVDWLRGQSVAIIPVHNSAPEPIVAELEKIMDAGESGLGHDLVKFQPVDRQNAVLVVAARPRLLQEAENWVSRLDGSTIGGPGAKVYRLKYGDAKQIAELLAKTFGATGGSSGVDSAASQVAPGAAPTTLSNIDRLTGGGKEEPAPTTPHPASDAGASPFGALAAKFDAASGGGGSGATRITADIANNAIVIYADEATYNAIERAILQLDRPKLQVAIDVTIAEVTLTDDLSYGVQFFIRNQLGSIGNSTGTNGAGTPYPLSPTAQGFNFMVGGLASPSVILSALHQYTDVKVLSNPSLVVVNNETATLEVGDQVPVSTGSANVLSSNNAVVNTIDYKNTGIILHVQPRVNSDGSVLLDVEQEISSVPNADTNAATTSSTLTPTISERKVKSELSVPNGQTVLLAGLVSETQSITHSGVPVLDQIPVVGAAFVNKDKSANRTELVLFIRPQVIRSGADAATVAEELRAKMRGGQLHSLGLPDLSAPDDKRSLK